MGGRMCSCDNLLKLGHKETDLSVTKSEPPKYIIQNKVKDVSNFEIDTNQIIITSRENNNKNDKEKNNEEPEKKQPQPESEERKIIKKKPSEISLDSCYKKKLKQDSDKEKARSPQKRSRNNSSLLERMNRLNKESKKSNTYDNQGLENIVQIHKKNTKSDMTQKIKDYKKNNAIKDRIIENMKQKEIQEKLTKKKIDEINKQEELRKKEEENKKKEINKVSTPGSLRGDKIKSKASTPGSFRADTVKNKTSTPGSLGADKVKNKVSTPASGNPDRFSVSFTSMSTFAKPTANNGQSKNDTLLIEDEKREEEVIIQGKEKIFLSSENSFGGVKQSFSASGRSSSKEYESSSSKVSQAAAHSDNLSYIED